MEMREQMKEEIKIGRVIQIIIGYLLVVVFLFAWPIGMIDQPVTSGTSDVLKGSTPAIYTTAELVQEFQPQCDYLETISFYVENDLQEFQYMTLMFYLFDQNEELIIMEELSLDGAEFPGILTIPVELDVDSSKNYVALLNSPYVELFLGTVEAEESGAIEHMNTYVESQLLEDEYAYVIYDYTTPVTFWWMIAYGLCSFFILALVGYCMNKLSTKYQVLQGVYSANNVIRTLLSITVLIAGIRLGVAIYPQQLFGSNLMDLIVYEITTITALCLFLYYINRILVPLEVAKTLFQKKRIVDYIQIAAFAGAFTHACYYMNAIYEYIHIINTAKIIVYLLIAMMTMIHWKQLKKVPTIVSTILAVIAGIIWYVTQSEVAVTQELAQWEAVACSLGLLAIYHLIRMVITKKINKISYVYFGLLVLFWVLQNVYRYERTWPLILVFPIGVYYLFFNSKENRTGTLLNMMYAVVCNYGGMVIYCLLHRPYHYYMRTRYPMYFHTVTITSMYLVLVFTVVFVLLLRAYQQKQHKRIPVLMVLLGSVVSYVLMTVSRTGLFTILAIPICILIVWFVVRKPSQWKQLGVRIGSVVLISMFMLPFTIMTTRIIPAIINEPIEVEIEVAVETIEKGDPMDSPRYVTVKRFLDLFCNGMGIDSNYFYIPGQGGLEEKSIQEVSQVEVVQAQVARMTNSVAVATKSTVASSDQPSSLGGSTVLDEVADYTNGRVDIWMAYLQEINLVGHETMGVVVWDELQSHAHNSFIQVMYDHGLIVGILFILLYFSSLARGFVYYKKNSSDALYLLPGCIIGAFGMVSIAEWAFHPCQPIGLAFLLMLAPLLGKLNKISVK
ncbi:MAG: hypothetical protein R3Y67_00110 [Eubacteriales bacterium]